MKIINLFIFLVLGVCVGWPQPRPEFEAASVKPVPENEGRLSLTGGPGTADPGRIRYENAPLKTLLLEAYGLERDQILGPGWIDSQRYTVIATFPPGTSKMRFQLMLQRLLTERFRLSLHHEPKEFTVYELVVAPDGPKLTPAASMNPDDAAAPAAQSEALDKSGCPAALRPGVKSRRDWFRRTTIGCSRYTKSSTGDLANSLSTFISMQEGGMPAFATNVIHVIDKTGLMGEYDFTLRFYFSPAVNAASLGEFAADAPVGAAKATVYSALEQQLGLQAKKTKALLDVIVIDHADKIPIENCPPGFSGSAGIQ